MASFVGLALAAAMMQVLKLLLLLCRVPMYYSAKVRNSPCLD